jgi:outer membrane immunogenic protein
LATIFPDSHMTLSQNLDWFSTFRGRLGWLVTPTIMLYGTGGLAYGEVNTTQTVNITKSFPVLDFADSSQRIGWTTGVGAEAALGHGWSAKIEYLYLDFGNVSDRFAPTFAPLLTTEYTSHITDNVVRLGANYKF